VRVYPLKAPMLDIHTVSAGGSGKSTGDGGMPAGGARSQPRSLANPAAAGIAHCITDSVVVPIRATRFRRRRP
jgi:N-methylhydantoinase A/oxoprolinase/acetone carboxylase beta subunit